MKKILPLIKLAKHQFDSEYVSTLKGLTGYYAGYIEDQTGIDYQMMKNDDVLGPAVEQMAMTVAGESFEISTNNEMLSRIIAEALQYCEDFTHCRMSLVEQSLLYGLGIQRIYFEKRWIDSCGMYLEVPVRTKEVDRERMRLEKEANKQKYYWTIWNPVYDDYQVIEDRKENPHAPLAMQDFLWYVYKHEELNPLYRGIGSILYKSVYIRNNLIKYYSQLCETWGQPWVTIEVDGAALSMNAASVLGSGFKNASKAIQEYAELFRNQKQGGVIAHSKKDKVQVKEYGGSSKNIIQDCLEYHDSRIRVAILGSELTTEAKDKGSFAEAQVQKGSQNVRVNYHRSRLQGVIKTGLIENTLFRNRTQLTRLGIRIPDKAKIGFKIKSEAEELRKDMLENGSTGQASDRARRAADKI